jgi:hypothetical protein
VHNSLGFLRFYYKNGISCKEDISLRSPNVVSHKKQGKYCGHMRGLEDNGNPYHILTCKSNIEDFSLISPSNNLGVLLIYNYKF